MVTFSSPGSDPEDSLSTDSCSFAFMISKHSSFKRVFSHEIGFEINNDTNQEIKTNN